MCRHKGVSLSRIDVLASEGTKKLHLGPEVIEIPNFVRQLIYALFLRFDQFNLFRDLFFEDLRIPRPTACRAEILPPQPISAISIMK